MNNSVSPSENTLKNFDKPTLAEVWPSIPPLITDGISLIPVRDKEINGRPAKTPLGEWKVYQTQRANEATLWEAMTKHNTTAIAAVCGEISGRLEVIDVDTKYNPGVDIQLLKDIRDICPDIYQQLRIHKTPSGGLHILYRIEDHDVEGNQKLAGKLGENGKAVNFLETRGEGGYILLPPSAGYSVVQGEPIPLLTWEERCSLINLCKAYNEIIKTVAPPTPTKREIDWYASNPFDDYNHRCDPVQLMEQHGWKVYGQSNRFIWFTRPGKSTGVSASFNRENRVFYMFTSSTQFEHNRGYNPATIYADLNHGGNKKDAFRALVDSGYGKLKSHIETKLARECAMTGKNMPKNASTEALKEYRRLEKEFAETYPYGTYWKFNKEGKPEISYSRFLSVAEHLGYRLRRNAIVQINGKFVEEVDNREFIDKMRDYIQGDDSENIDLMDAFEKFVQASIKNIILNRLQPFDDDAAICDDANTAYKFFQNGLVEITADKASFREYKDVDGLVFVDKIIQRDYEPNGPRSDLFEQFLKNATDVQRKEVTDYIKNIIGWLSHDYNSPANIYIIIMTEMVVNPKDGGGSGKNVLANLLSQTIGMSIASGSMVKWDDKFFSVWKPSKRLLFIPDLPKYVDWPFLKNAVENPLINRKYEQEYSVPTEDAPKLLFNTNYSFDDVDGGLKRRIRTIEFTDYYTVRGGIDAVHGKLFPHDWADDDWNGFISFILECIQLNLSNSGKIELQELSGDGKIKKFIAKYSERVFEFFNEYIDHWCQKRYVTTAEFNDNFTTFFEGEKPPNWTNPNVPLEEYCVLLDIKFIKNTKKQGIRVREFFRELDEADDGIPF